MKIVNLTPHDVVVQLQDRKVIFPSPEPNATGYVENVPRVETECGETSDQYGVPIMTAVRKVSNEPPKQKDTLYIVSNIVLDFLSDRHDLIAPDTKEAPRDDKDRIISVRRFIRNGTLKDIGKSNTIGDIIKGKDEK